MLKFCALLVRDGDDERPFLMLFASQNPVYCVFAALEFETWERLPGAGSNVLVCAVRPVILGGDLPRES